MAAKSLTRRFAYAANQRTTGVNWDHEDLFAPLDVCENRHGGNEESRSAFLRILRSMPQQRRFILETIRAAGQRGRTCDELAALLHVDCNKISGRLSELKRDGLITKAGTRPTRSGSAAAVLVAL